MKKRQLPRNEFDIAIGNNARAIAKSYSSRGAVEILAEAMETTTGHASDLVNGKRRWSTTYLKRVTDFFQCSAAALFVGATPHDRGQDSLILSAYYALDDDDKKIVDKFLFRGQSHPSLTSGRARAQGSARHDAEHKR